MASCKKRPKQHLPSATGPEPRSASWAAGVSGTPVSRAGGTREKSELVEALMRNAGASQPRRCMPAAPPDDWAADAAGISGGRMPCSVCGRRFALDR